LLCSWNDLRKELLTTMAISTVETITRDGMSIGLSKSLVNLYNDGDLTPQELARFSYAAWEALECNAYATTEIDISSWQGAAVTAQLSYFQSPIGGSNIVSAYVNDLLPTKRLYCFNILLYTDRKYVNLTLDNTSNCKIVTDIDLTDCAMTLNSAPSVTGNVSIDYPDLQTINTFTSGASSYWNNDDLVKHWNGRYWSRMDNIRPYCVIANESGILFITQGSYFGDNWIGGFGVAGFNFCPMNALDLPDGNHIINQKWRYSQGDIVDYTKTKHLLRWIGNDQEYEAQTWGSGSKKGAWDYDDNFFVIMSQTNQAYGSATDEYHIYPKSLNVVKRLIACVGLNVYIGSDKKSVIKPLIKGGLVVGYSEDAATPSEIDNITNVTGNNISPFPPAPGPTPVDPWDVDPETYGWSGGEVSGMVKYYLLTSGEMSSLRSEIASNANWTIDYLNCIVSCFVVPNSGIFFDAPISSTVRFKLDNATVWDTGVACKRIQGTINKIGGTIEIPRLTNTFYDFEPYSDYSVYIPFCGRIPIKGNICLGRAIKVTYYPDVPTCSLTAVVSCGGATIAITKGSFGTMTPVTSNGSDRKTAAVIGDVAPIITGIGTGIVGVALGNPLIVGAGATQSLGGIMGGVKETVQSYAYSVGSSGDSSFFSAGNRCYYYANYPVIDDVVNNSMFGHSVGYLCNTVGKLSGFTGFTICANPHVTFSATFEEKEEIERLLSMGVIL